MHKMQILFPDPLMMRMKTMAQRLDIPVSEVVRRAIEQWLERFPEQRSLGGQVPVIDAGQCLLPADQMKEALYE